MGGEFAPTASRERLAARAGLLARLRSFFVARGFLEVETPLLSCDVVVDRHLDPLWLTLYENPVEPSVGPRYFLQTSPEFAMKRLVAAGHEAIFQITKAFRAAERGPQHNPEFTLLEWYRVGDDLRGGIDLLAQLVREVIPAASVTTTTYGGLFRAATGLDPHRCADGELQSWAQNGGRASPDFAATDRDAWLDWVWTQYVEPTIPREIPTIVMDFPASKAALARTRVEDGVAVAERFELFFRGLELANGYHELLDAATLRARQSQANRGRLADRKSTLPEESRLLAAMEAGLPPCAGAALGVDRLLMALVGATSIDEVIAFPVERA